MFSRIVDIVVADLRVAEIDTGILATSELVHAGALESAAARGEYLAARTWLRQILAGYLRYQPSQLRFLGGRQAPDSIVSPITDLDYSFCYSGRLAVVALAFRQDLGVAAKRLDDRVEPPERIDAELTLDEHRKVAGAHDPSRTLWKFAVRKRALAKSVGEELARKIPDLDVSGPAPIEHLGRQIIDLYVANDVVAAVASLPGAEINVVFGESKQPVTTVVSDHAVGGSAPA